MRNDYTDTVQAVAEFGVSRGWDHVHTPRHLALAILVEAGELAEHVQWIDDEEFLANLERDSERLAVASEMADVLIHLIQLANVTNIDLLAAVEVKLAANAVRYPENKVYGNPRKRPIKQ